MNKLHLDKRINFLFKPTKTCFLCYRSGSHHVLPARLQEGSTRTDRSRTGVGARVQTGTGQGTGAGTRPETGPETGIGTGIGGTINTMTGGTTGTGIRTNLGEIGVNVVLDTV